MEKECFNRRSQHAPPQCLSYGTFINDFQSKQMPKITLLRLSIALKNSCDIQIIFEISPCDIS